MKILADTKPYLPLVILSEAKNLLFVCHALCWRDVVAALAEHSEIALVYCEVLTAKNNLTAHHCRPDRRDSFFNLIVDLAFGELRRHADGILDRVRVGRSVRDDAHTLDP